LRFRETEPCTRNTFPVERCSLTITQWSGTSSSCIPQTKKQKIIPEGQMLIVILSVNIGNSSRLPVHYILVV